MGERSHKKSEAIAARKAEAALLASEARVAEQLADCTSKPRRARSVRRCSSAPAQTGRSRQAIAHESPNSARWLPDLKDVRVRVSGFADSRGDDALNLSLSQERAEMVARELEKAGVPKERMIIEAMGERFASSEAVADDQAFERCVEIRFESGTSLASN